MSKVIFKIKGNYSFDTLERMEVQIKQSFEQNGFIIVDDKIDVFVIEDREDE